MHNAAKQRLETAVNEDLKEGLAQLSSFEDVEFYARQDATVYKPPSVLTVCENCALASGLEDAMVYEAELDIYITTSLVKVDVEGNAKEPGSEHAERAGLVEQRVTDSVEEFMARIKGQTDHPVLVHYVEAGALQSMSTERTWVDKVPLEITFQHVVM